jgi:hypothetical protein
LREVCCRARIVAGMLMAIDFPFAAYVIETGPSGGPRLPPGRPRSPHKGIDRSRKSGSSGATLS